MSAPDTARLKRLSMRSWRRGTKEMDLILGPFADARLAAMAPEMLERYEALLCENDQDLYPWMTGAVPAPAAHAGLIAEISDFLRSHRAAAR
jgi:antitoxin CptB